MPGTTTFSNADEVGAWIVASVTEFGFRSHVNGQTLAMAIVDNHVQQIRERSYAEQKGAGAPWPENEPEYARQKMEEYGSDLINVRTGQMLEDDALRGQVSATDRQIDHLYGTGRPGDSNERRKPTRSGKPRRARPEPTDIAKAGWADEQGRGFFELDDQIRDKNADLVADALAEHLRNR